MVAVERWLTHPVYIDYEVSDFGSVRRLTAKGGTRIGRLKKLSLNGSGYLVASIEGKPRRVHALVLECFIGPRPEKHDACHNDGNRVNNVLSNLRWATRKENMQDAKRHGTAQINADKLRAYWRDPMSRALQAERVRAFYAEHPESGRAGCRMSAESRAKMSDAKKGKKQSRATIAARVRSYRAAIERRRSLVR